MRRFTPFGCILAAAVLIPASTADALIQIDRGIAGARIGNTRAEVRAALGSPSKTTSGTNDFGPYVQYTFAGGIRVVFQGRTRVTSVRLTGRGDRTSKGVGVGSSEASVKANVSGITCETFGTFRTCHTGSGNPGQRITDFQMRNGRVRAVVVGIVID
jgi:hypothetical protein